MNARSTAEIVHSGEWACRELASRLLYEAADARSERLTDGLTDAYDSREFVARNRAEQLLVAADALKVLRHGPDDHGLPWPTRERLRLALNEALAALDDHPTVASVAPPADSSTTKVAATQHRQGSKHRGG